MNKLVAILVLSLVFVACKKGQTKDDAPTTEVTFSPTLADELGRMAEVDQIAAYIPQGKYEQLSQEEWEAFKDSVFTTHQKRLKEIFDAHGFVGFDLAGEEGSQNFWLMVQHSDHNPGFQEAVLDKMKLEVDRDNAKASNYGLLVDRVKLNKGEKQVYGTQVTYNMETGQAYPKDLEDSLNVNERRKAVGLEPIENYLNDMTQMHFEMNKKYYNDKGVTAPTLYPSEN